MVTHDLHDRDLCLSSFQTGFMDGDGGQGWQFVAAGALEKWPINLKELSNDSGSNPDHDLSGAKSSSLTDSSLVGFEFVYPASCWADSQESHGELTDHTPPGV